MNAHRLVTRNPQAFRAISRRFKSASRSSSDPSIVPINHRRGSPSEQTLEGLLSSALKSARQPGGTWLSMDEISELRYLALTDDLTSLYNRRGFFAAATQQLRLARRHGQNLLLFFCDIDGLKQINDTLGHRNGDLAIVRAAETLEKVFRDSDVIARLGGDEFAVLACEASSRSEESMLRRLHKGFQKADKQNGRFSVSVSVGVARFDPSRSAGLAELIAQADEAMYQIKKARPISRRA